MRILRRVFLLLAFFLITSLFAMFTLNQENIWVYIYLKFSSFGAIPSIICFSWLYMWGEAFDPLRFLSRYNSLAQGLFIVLNLIRVPFNRLGLFGVLYIVLSFFLILIYLTDWAYSRRGFHVTGGLILLNVLFAFGLVMTTFEQVPPYFLGADPGLASLRDFIAEISIMGALLVASSQLYWHELLKKRREEEMLEKLFRQLE